jgi:hypothetical protein
MTHHQWETIERTLSDLTVPDKLELIERIVQSIRVNADDSTERTARQRNNLNLLRQEMASMPETGTDDGLSNRDHDAILYGRPS